MGLKKFRSERKVMKLCVVFLFVGLSLVLADDAKGGEEDPENVGRSKRSVNHYDGPDIETYSYTHHPSYASPFYGGYGGFGLGHHYSYRRNHYSPYLPLYHNYGPYLYSGHHFGGHHGKHHRGHSKHRGGHKHHKRDVSDYDDHHDDHYDDHHDGGYGKKHHKKSHKKGGYGYGGGYGGYGYGAGYGAGYGGYGYGRGLGFGYGSGYLPFGGHAGYVNTCQCQQPQAAAS